MYIGNDFYKVLGSKNKSELVKFIGGESYDMMIVTTGTYAHCVTELKKLK